MQTVQEIFGPARRIGDVGIEIEVEGFNIPKDEVDVWKPIADGSLRGEAMEYVTRKPIKIGEVYDKVKLLADAFVANRGEARDAHRGSIHIHHNVQDKTMDQVFGIVFVWTMVEPLWMRKCGPTREANLFCLPGSYTGDNAHWCRAFFQCIREGSYHRFPPRGKYAALNTDPIAKFGSVEFRTFASSIDPFVVAKYAKWCHNLVNYGAAIDMDNLSKAWQKVQVDPRGFATAIFGAGDGLLMDEEERFLIEAGLEAASDLVLAYANHKTAMKIKETAKPKVSLNDYEDVFRGRVGAGAGVPPRRRGVNEAPMQWIFDENL